MPNHAQSRLTGPHPLFCTFVMLRTTCTRWMLFAATPFALINSTFAFEDAPIGINLAKLLSVQLEPPEVLLPGNVEPAVATEGHVRYFA